MSTPTTSSPTTPNADTRPCPECGTAIPPESPEGMCPRCVLGRVALPPPDPAGGRPAERQPSLEAVAAAFPQLEIVEVIGAGGMGVVYKARQKHLDRFVALKLLPAALAADPSFSERFNREARVLARLNHPNIVTVYDYGQSGGFPFLLMEYVDGVNLRQGMRAGRFTPAEALRLVPKICEALQFAHDEGILHRDIKPENILLDARGRVKIADFGIAKLLGDAKQEFTLTRSGAALGTPQYMAPEQIERPCEVDHRADLYSLGVVFYELLTGELPIGRFEPPSRKSPSDERIDAIVMRALAKEREQRQQSATEMKTEVEGVAQKVSAEAASLSSTPESEARPAPSGAEEPHDFLLCHPSLPRMAQAITVYALVIAPFLGLLDFLTHDFSEPDAVYARFVKGVIGIIYVFGTLGITAMLMWGGKRLRQLHPGGPRWIRMAVVARFVWCVALVALEIALESLQPTVSTPPGADRLSYAEALVGLLGLGQLTFEGWSWFWLRRHAHRLAAVFASARPASAQAAEELASTMPTRGTAPRATVSAVLTGSSLGLGLAFLGGAALWWVGWRQGGDVGSLGPVELMIVLAGLAMITGLAVGGMVAGARALRAIRDSRGSLGGLGRAAFGAFGWPLVGAELVGVAGLGYAVFELNAPGFVVLLVAIGVGWIAGVFGLRAVWRWARGLPAGHKAGYSPGWIHGVALAATLAAMVALIPAASVGLKNRIRANLPSMALVVEPDPSVPVESAGSRSAMLLNLNYPGRTIVWVETALFREDVLQTSPFSTMHVINGGFEDLERPLLLRAVEPANGENVEWEMVVNTGTSSATFQAPVGDLGRIRWTVVGLAASEIVKPHHPRTVDVMSGVAEDGSRWRLALFLRVEPLIPAVLGDGLVVGQGNDWSTTAKSLPPLE